jgi:hypothetical protein
MSVWPWRPRIGKRRRLHRRRRRRRRQIDDFLETASFQNKANALLVLARWDHFYSPVIHRTTEHEGAIKKQSRQTI